MGAIRLSDRDKGLLAGVHGRGPQLAMELILKAAEVSGAEQLIDVTQAHVGSGYLGGRITLDFVEFLVSEGTTVAIPTRTAAVLLDSTNRDICAAGISDERFETSSRLMELAERLGCEPVWTCAPYLLPGPPGLGEQIVGSESNAVTYFNSVLGARTNKYGDYLDICAAITGRVPYAGLHTDEGRRGRLLFRLSDLPGELLEEDIFYHVLGHFVGRRAGDAVSVIEGLRPPVHDDQLKAISAAVAASGGVSLFHAPGITPEAPTTSAAFQGEAPEAVIEVTPQELVAARDSLSSLASGGLNAVCVGTPHFSLSEMEQAVALLRGRRVHADVHFYISTCRFVAELARTRGWLDALAGAGAELVLDICTYTAPVVRGCEGEVMTNSAKWAYYAPGFLNVHVAFGSLRECVESAVRGRVWRDPRLWSNDFWGFSSCA